MYSSTLHNFSFLTISQHTDGQSVVASCVPMDEQDGLVQRLPAALPQPIFAEQVHL